MLSNYNQTSSVYAMELILSFPSLASCRKVLRLTFSQDISSFRPWQQTGLPSSIISLRLDHNNKIGIPLCKLMPCFSHFFRVHLLSGIACALQPLLLLITSTSGPQSITLCKEERLCFCTTNCYTVLLHSIHCVTFY